MTMSSSPPPSTRDKRNEMDQDGDTDGSAALKVGTRLPDGVDCEAIFDQRVKDAMSRVPRHLFVGPKYTYRAYDDTSLPIGHGQTISQPFIVALMTQYLDPKPGAKILEIGTGSGYQAAVLAELGAEVFTIEIIPSLSAEAQDKLTALEYYNVSCRVGDGSHGWPEEAPFAGILIAAAAPHPPPELLQQLADGGKMILPLENERRGSEVLTLIERHGETFKRRRLEGVRFVPMVGAVRSL